MGDNRVLLKDFADNSIHAVVCDPPYELSNDGKTSPSGVFLEVMFPKIGNLETQNFVEIPFQFLVNQILGLDGVGVIPAPPTTVKKTTLTLNNEIPGWDENISNSQKPSRSISERNGCPANEPETSEYLGSFYLELADMVSAKDALNHAGCCFAASGFGIGFRISASSLPRFFTGLGSIPDSDDDRVDSANSLPLGIGTLNGTENEPMPSFQLRRGFENRLTATSALKFFAALQLAGSKIIRTNTGTSGLTTPLQTCRISVISPLTNRALSFDLITHEFNIASKGFMGKDWDGSKVAYDVALWREVLRVLRPGGYLLAFGGTRTYHRMACAIEDAGFEIRDQIQWLFGSGFPKSFNVSKAMDADAGAEREVVGRYQPPGMDKPWNLTQARNERTVEILNSNRNNLDITAAATPEAQDWDGWGTALKPAHEPICMARKPLSEDTIIANIRRWGTGALNIDACRVGFQSDADQASAFPGGKITSRGSGTLAGPGSIHEPRRGEFDTQRNRTGRWPANIAHDGSEEVLEAFPESPGQQGDVRGTEPSRTGSEGTNCYNEYGARPPAAARQDGGGSAARFFYCAKATSADRHGGVLDEIKPTMAHGNTLRKSENLEKNGNYHPTVKPVSLMQWLVRMVCPPGGTVLDPFMGSGSTGKACAMEGFDFVGMDLDPEYVRIAEARIAHVSPAMAEIVRAENVADVKAAAPQVVGGQIELF